MDQWEKNMFGYISIYEPELKMKDFRRYKAYYCGLCKALKEQFGSVGQLTWRGSAPGVWTG